MTHPQDFYAQPARLPLQSCYVAPREAESLGAWL